MLLYRYYLQMIIRVLLITVTCMAFAITWVKTDNYVTLFNIGLLVIIQVVLLIYYLNKINRDLKHFLETIQNEDANLTFSRKWKYFKGIYQLMEEVNEKIQAVRESYAVQSRYFRTVVEHIQTGLVAFTQDGHIELMNQAAKRMLGIDAPGQIKSLDYCGENLKSVFLNLKPSENKSIKLNIGMRTTYLTLYCTVLDVGNRTIKIVTFHNIQSELDANEIESWQKLIRVLNHEIMNSIAPILSTLSTLSGYFSGSNKNAGLPDGYISDRIYKKTASGLEMMRERSEGLKQFAKKYKNLSQIEEPEYTVFSVKDLFNTCKLMIEDQLQNNKIQCTTTIVNNDFELVVDRKLFQQVLINLMKNAIESLSESDIENRKIELRAIQRSNNKISIQIIDNGKGIPNEMMDQIFVPFFTTKNNGSGIGLSLSKQILRKHGWTIGVISIPFQETTFTISN